MKRYHSIFSAIAITLLVSSVQAQTNKKDTTMNRTVVVEQEYAPDILDANKVNVLPKVEEPTVNKEVVNYATTPAPASNIPSTTMQPYMGKESQRMAHPGYARLGYGNYGNLDVLGNYLFRFTGRDRLNLNLQVDGMDGKLDIPESDQPWKSYYYRTKAGIDLLHQFDKVDLNIGGNFGLSNFNYFQYAPASKQKFTSGDIRVGVKSTDEMQSIQYQAEANLLFYQRQHDFIGSDLSEKILRTKAEVSFPIGSIHRIAIDAEMNNVFLNNGLENYSLIEINPAYEWENDFWKLHLGVHTDIGLGAEEGIHLSPDVKIQFTFSDHYVLYAKATGGDKLNDFRQLEALSPYSTLMSQPAHTHERINTALGFKASPVPGLWFDLFAGYQNIEDDLCEGYNSVMTEGDIMTPYISFRQTNTNNTYAGLRLNYTWKDIFALQTSGTFRSWNADDQAALLMAPQLDLRINADIRPISSLLLNVGYQHTTREGVSGFTEISPISNLYLGGEYRFLNGVSVYTRINNVLNKDYSYYLGYPSEGFNFVGGVAFRF